MVVLLSLPSTVVLFFQDFLFLAWYRDRGITEGSVVCTVIRVHFQPQTQTIYQTLINRWRDFLSLYYILWIFVTLDVTSAGDYLITLCCAMACVWRRFFFSIHVQFFSIRCAMFARGGSCIMLISHAASRFVSQDVHTLGSLEKVKKFFLKMKIANTKLCHFLIWFLDTNFTTWEFSDKKQVFHHIFQIFFCTRQIKEKLNGFLKSTKNVLFCILIGGKGL